MWKNLSRSLYNYDKTKVNLLKAILPLIIIVHHIYNLWFKELEFIGAQGDIVMYIFFAMSGYGLTISYIKNADYINGFLKKSLTKLFIPYIFTLILFIIYRYSQGIDQVELFKSEGLCSLVPTSWFIWVLSLFYIFFYICFKYIKTNNRNKVLLTCFLVLAYCLVAPQIGIEFWRYFRCPGFCVGMVFALCDKYIRNRMVLWHMLLILSICFILKFHNLIPIKIEPIFWPAILFIILYMIKPIKEFKLIKFLSSISLEMFIIQFIPIYILTNDFKAETTTIVVLGVLILDIFFAFALHKLVLKFRPFLERIYFDSLSQKKMNL